MYLRYVYTCKIYYRFRIWLFRNNYSKVPKKKIHKGAALTWTAHVISVLSNGSTRCALCQDQGQVIDDTVHTDNLLLVLYQEFEFKMNLSSSGNLAVEGMMYFLSRDDRYNQEKPYTLRYAPGGGLPQTNIDRTQYSIKFHDIRRGQSLLYKKCGFKVATLQSQMQYEDYDDVDKVESIHGPEVARCVKEALKANSAEVLDHVVSQLSCRCMILVAVDLVEPTDSPKASNLAHRHRRNVRFSTTSVKGSYR